jgi:hypothetical protein
MTGAWSRHGIGEKSTENLNQNILKENAMYEVEERSKCITEVDLKNTRCEEIGCLQLAKDRDKYTVWRASRLK